MQHKELAHTFNEVIIELSFNCNLSCQMCGFGKEVKPFSSDNFLPFDKFKEIFKQIADKTKTIRLNGRGESTIHPDFTKILDYIKEQKPTLSINLFSNLSFNNSEIVDSLINSNVQLFISMDSPHKENLEKIRRGANFEAIKKNIEQLAKIETHPFIIFTIQEDNLNEIYDIGKFAYENKCHILFNTVRRDEGIEYFQEAVNNNFYEISEQFEDVRELYKDSKLQCLYPNQLAGISINSSEYTETHGTMEKCPALESELCILHDGTVTPCNMFNPFSYGNIFENSLSEIWSSNKRCSFLSSYKDHYYCKNCANLGV